MSSSSFGPTSDPEGGRTDARVTASTSLLLLPPGAQARLELLSCGRGHLRSSPALRDHPSLAVLPGSPLSPAAGDGVAARCFASSARVLQRPPTDTRGRSTPGRGKLSAPQGGYIYAICCIYLCVSPKDTNPKSKQRFAPALLLCSGL